MKDEESSTGFVCDNRDCRVSETGNCVEGLAREKCPHFGKEQTTETAPGATEQTVLRPAGRLSSEKASAVLRRTATRVIAIIGPREAGKTSLIASVYDLFQLGPIGDVIFAGSQTMHAFEIACHDARAASGRTAPVTHRTPRGDVQFYHLQVVCGGVKQGIALLLSDRAGEDYSAAGDDTKEATGFVEVVRADTLTVLVDGNRLADPHRRHHAAAEVRMMLAAIGEAGIIPDGQRLAVVLTKNDLLKEADGGEAAVEAAFDRLFAALQSAQGKRFGEVASFRIAASPQMGDVPRGDGVQALLNYWLKPSAPPQPITSRPSMGARSFSWIAHTVGKEVPT
jgi:hypothetical protein